MTIRFKLDDTAVPGEVLGSIVISDGRHEFAMESTWVDTWLSSLASGLIAVEEARPLRLDITEEPTHVRLDLNGRALNLTLDDTRLEFDAREFEQDLRAVARTLLDNPCCRGREEDQLLQALRAFVKSDARFE